MCPVKKLWPGNYPHKDCVHMPKTDGCVRCVWCDQPQPKQATHG